MTGSRRDAADPAAGVAPFAPHWHDVGAARMHYVDEGPRDAPVVVMLHGNPTWSFYWRHLIEPLARHHRVIAPDHVGCGRSDKPPGHPYRLRGHIENLTRLLDHIGVEHATLAVHDWGGAIGFGWAVEHPERVERLVVTNTAAFPVARCPLRIRLCRVPGLGAFLVRGLNGFLRASFVFGTSRPERFGADVRRGYLAPYPDWASRVALHAFVLDIPLAADHPSRATLDAIEAKLPALAHVPMQILWGADDFCFTARHFLPEWRRRFPNAEVHVLEGAGHYVAEDAPERLLPLIETFLAGAPPAPER